jgi:hypothetical protein
VENLQKFFPYQPRTLIKPINCRHLQGENAKIAVFSGLWKSVSLKDLEKGRLSAQS